MRVDLQSRSSEVGLNGREHCPEFVFANDEDNAYGRFLLEPG